MADWSLPDATSPYPDVPGLLKDLATDAATLFANEPTSPIDGMIKLQRSPVVLQQRATGAWNDLLLSINGGGTGASTASAARTNLGLGSLAVQDASAVAITGGTIDGATITNGSISGATISGTVSGNGSGLTSLNASNLASGTVPQARKWTDSTLTLTGNQDNVDFSNADLVRLNNASLLTIRGLAAGVPGQQVTLVSVGAGQVDFANQNSNSNVTNRIICGVTATISLAAGVGRVTLVYDGTTQRWRVVSHQQGAYIAVSYSASNFTASGSMTWTVDSADQATYAYMLTQRMLTIVFVIRSSSVGGTPSTQLKIAIPGGFSPARETHNPVAILDNTTRMAGNASIGAGATAININKIDYSNWSTTTNSTDVQGEIVVEVQ